jgi:hypothetical protein
MYLFQVGTAVHRPQMNGEAEAKKELWRGLFICMNFERSEALQGEQSRR